MDHIAGLNLLALTLAVATAICTAIAASNGMWRPGEPDEKGKARIDTAKLVGLSAAIAAAVVKLLVEFLEAVV